MSVLRLGKIEITEWKRPCLVAIAGGTPPSEPPTGPMDIHPGIIIQKRLMPKGADATWLAVRSELPNEQAVALLNGGLRITPDLATSLVLATNMSPMFFMNLQHRHDQLKKPPTAPAGPAP